MRPVRAIAAGLLAGLVAFTCVGCGGGDVDADAPVVLSGRAMGTHYEVRYFGQVEGESMRELIEAFLEEFDRELSTYRADSDISRFNGAEAGAPFAVRSRLRDVVELGEELRRRTGGALDMTVKPLRDLYDREVETGRRPTAEELEAARALVGEGRLSLDGRGLSKDRDGVQVDVNAVAKGHGVDCVGGLLLQAGIDSFKIDIGGEVLCRGRKPDGRPWVIGVESPDHPGDVDERLAEVALDGMGLAQSGSYRNFAVRDGEVVHHIFDPRTGRSATNRTVAVAVVAPTCALADGLATALMVLGHEAGAEVVRSYRQADPPVDVRAVFAERGGDRSLVVHRVAWD